MSEDLLPIKHYVAIRRYLASVHGTAGTSPITGAPLPRIPRADAMLILGIFAPSVRGAVAAQMADQTDVFPSPVQDESRLFSSLEKRDLLAWVLGKPSSDPRQREIQATPGAPLESYWLPAFPWATDARARASISELMAAWDRLYRSATDAAKGNGAFMSLPEVTAFMGGLYEVCTKVPLAHFAWSPSVADEVYESAKEVAADVGEAAGDALQATAEAAAGAINTVSEGFLNTIGLWGAAAIVAVLVLKKYRLI